MIYDRTCRGRGPMPGLTHAWWAGANLYRGLRRLDAYRGVDSWAEALDFLANFAPQRPIGEVQYWGHGKWGLARVDREVFDRHALTRGHSLYEGLQRVRDRMRPSNDGLFWFRTCETFGARPGKRFAAELSDFLDCRVAGHTYIIGHVQSGLHSLRPGETPTWSDDEGLLEGSVERPKRAHWSKLRAPNTITCLHGRVPPRY